MTAAVSRDTSGRSQVCQRQLVPAVGLGSVSHSLVDQHANQADHGAAHCRAWVYSTNCAVGDAVADRDCSCSTVKFHTPRSILSLSCLNNRTANRCFCFKLTNYFDQLLYSSERWTEKIMNKMLSYRRETALQGAL